MLLPGGDLPRTADLLERFARPHTALEQARPVVPGRNRALPVIRRPRPLVGHLEEQQIRQLLDVIAVAHPVVKQDVAVVPELLGNRGCVHPVLEAIDGRNARRRDEPRYSATTMTSFSRSLERRW